jgi:putative protease
MNNVMKILEMAAGCDGVVVSNTGILNLAHQKGIPAIADFPLNIFNCYSASLLNETGAGLLTVSPELTLREIREITQSFEAEAIIESRLELMVSEYCLLTELPGCGSHFERADQSALYEFTDEKGFSFPVFADRQGRTHVLNSRKLSMLDRLQDLIEAGLSSIRIDARRDEDNLERITAAYRQALDSEMTVQRQGKNYTHGHYYRGVL